MEMVYSTTPHTNIPGVYCIEHGKGRVVYFPMDIDRTFWEVLSVDHLTVLRNAITWAADETSPMQIKGPGLLDVSLWRQKQSITAHIVNLTNPMAMKGSFRELIPVQANVSIRIPENKKVNGVHLLMTGTNPAFENKNGRVELRVPQVMDHEIVALDLV